MVRQLKSFSALVQLAAGLSAETLNPIVSQQSQELQDQQKPEEPPLPDTASDTGSESSTELKQPKETTAVDANKPSEPTFLPAKGLDGKYPFEPERGFGGRYPPLTARQQKLPISITLEELSKTVDPEDRSCYVQEPKGNKTLIRTDAYDSLYASEVKVDESPSQETVVTSPLKTKEQEQLQTEQRSAAENNRTAQEYYTIVQEQQDGKRDSHGNKKQCPDVKIETQADGYFGLEYDHETLVLLNGTTNPTLQEYVNLSENKQYKIVKIDGVEVRCRLQLLHQIAQAKYDAAHEKRTMTVTLQPLDMPEPETALPDKDPRGDKKSGLFRRAYKGVLNHYGLRTSKTVQLARDFDGEVLVPNLNLTTESIFLGLNDTALTNGAPVRLKDFPSPGYFNKNVNGMEGFFRPGQVEGLPIEHVKVEVRSTSTKDLKKIAKSLNKILCGFDQKKFTDFNDHLKIDVAAIQKNQTVLQFYVNKDNIHQSMSRKLRSKELIGAQLIGLQHQHGDSGKVERKAARTVDELNEEFKSFDKHAKNVSYLKFAPPLYPGTNKESKKIEILVRISTSAKAPGLQFKDTLKINIYETSSVEVLKHAIIAEIKEINSRRSEKSSKITAILPQDQEIFINFKENPRYNKPYRPPYVMRDSDRLTTVFKEAHSLSKVVRVMTKADFQKYQQDEVERRYDEETSSSSESKVQSGWNSFWNLFRDDDVQELEQQHDLEQPLDDPNVYHDSNTGAGQQEEDISLSLLGNTEISDAETREEDRSGSDDCDDTIVAKAGESDVQAALI